MAVTVQVGGVYPPLSTPSITGQVVTGDGHLVGWNAAAQFGPVTTRFDTRVLGVPSAAAFGDVTAAVVLAAFGVPSAQAFGVGAIHAEVTISLVGLGSAQRFGDPVVGLVVRNVWIWPTDWVSSVRESAICGEVICGDGHLVGGWEYLPAAGTPDTLVLDPSEVETLELVPTVSK
jgi:hypothetical protein